MGCTLSNTVMLIIAVFVLVVVAVAFYMYAQTNAGKKEDFQTASPAYAAYMTGTYQQNALNSMMQADMISRDPDTQPDPDTTPVNDCLVYYVPPKYQYACKKGFFDYSNSYLKAKIAEFDAIGFNNLDSSQKEDYVNINLVIEARNKNLGKDGGYGCKLGFPEMISKIPVMDKTDQTTIDSRNGLDKNGNQQTSSGHWAYCWGKVGTYADANANINRIGNKGAVEATPNQVTQFAGSSDLYYRVQFNDLDYNSLKQAMCSITPTNRNIPENTALIGFQIDVNMRIKDYGIFVVDNGTVKTLKEFYPKANPVVVFATMFEPKQINKVLYLKAKDTPFSQVVRITEDRICNVVTKYEKDPKLTINLETQFGLTAEKLADVPSGYDFSGGFDSIDAEYNKIMQKYLDLKNDYESLVSFQNAIPNDPKLRAGTNVTQYNLTGVTYSDNRAYSNSGMDDVFKNNTSSPTTTIVTNPNTASWKTDNKAWVITGYLDLSEQGTYTFKISSDDAGELFVDNQLISTHYGYHGMNNTATSREVKTGSVSKSIKGKVPFTARFFELGGGEGIYLYWKTPGNPNWTLIPDSAFYRFDDAINYTTQINAAKQKMDEYVFQLEVISNYRNSLASTSYDAVQNIMKRSIGTQFTVIDKDSKISSYVSSYDWIYLYFGTPSSVLPPQVSPTTKQVMQENVINCATQFRIVDPPKSIDYTSLPVYSVSLWIYVEQQCPAWRTVFFHGASDDWMWRGNWHIPGIDRTPGLWIYPTWHNSSGNVYMHFRHRVDSKGQEFWSKNEGVDVADNKFAKPLKKWFHYAVTVNKTVIKVYIDGKLANSVDYSGKGWNLEWNITENKKFRIGFTEWSDKRTETQYGAILMQKLYWWNSVLDDSQIKLLSEESIVSPSVLKGAASTITPAAVEYTLLRDLFANIVTPGINYLTLTRSNGQKTQFPVYVDITQTPVRDQSGNIVSYKKQYWALILNYVHKANTYPELFPRTMNDGFPQLGNVNLGTDGSLDRSSYGHLGNGFLKAVYDQCKFTTLRFYAKGGNCKYGWDQWSPQCNSKVIHFTTSDPRWISYVTTGKGGPGGNFQYNLMIDHNSSIPQNIDWGFGDQGDYALTEFPFYKNATAHWGIGGGKGWLGLRYRYEVDDWGRNMYNTLHQVWIGVD